MKNTNITVLGLILSLLLCITYGVNAEIPQQERIIITEENEEIISPKITLITHDPIIIDGNEDFANQATTEGWSGNGSISNPYCILNYYISSSGESGIDIRNTGIFFIVENVTVTGATNSLTGAFQLVSVQNGKLLNNTAMNSYTGFLLYSSSNNILSSNNATNNSKNGFDLSLSSNCILCDNIATANGFIGFRLSSSSNYNILTGNIATDNNDDGFILALSCYNSININTAANNRKDGFDLYSSSNNILSGNNATNNSDNGYNIYSSSNYNIIDGNIATYSYNGFRLAVSSIYNTLKYNNFTYNGYYGLYISDASNNSIYINTFIGNNNGNIQAYSNSQNYWSNGTHGNYWNDYTGIDSNGDGIGDTTYPIDGDGAESDIYPLMMPVEYVISEFSSTLLPLSSILGFISFSVLFNKKSYMW